MSKSSNTHTQTHNVQLQLQMDSYQIEINTINVLKLRSKIIKVILQNKSENL